MEKEKCSPIGCRRTWNLCVWLCTLLGWKGVRWNSGCLACWFTDFTPMKCPNWAWFLTPSQKGFLCFCAFLLGLQAPVYTAAALTKSSARVHVVFAHFSCEHGLIRCFEHPQRVTAYSAYWMFGVAAIFRNGGISPSSIKSCKWAFFLNVKIENTKLSINHFILKSHISILGSSASSAFSIQ